MWLPSRKAVSRPIDLLSLAHDAAQPISHREILERHFAAHHEAIYRFLRSCGAAGHLAEDLSQEAFLRLHRHLTSGRPAQNVRAWLFRVAYRLWVDGLREGQREAPAQSGNWEMWSDVLRDPSPGAEAELLARERWEWLRAAVLRLSQIERQALHLRADGLQYREIAEVLGVGYWSVVEAVRRAPGDVGRAGSWALNKLGAPANTPPPRSCCSPTKTSFRARKRSRLSRTCINAGSARAQTWSSTSAGSTRT